MISHKINLSYNLIKKDQSAKFKRLKIKSKYKLINVGVDPNKSSQKIHLQVDNGTRSLNEVVDRVRFTRSLNQITQRSS